MAPHAIDGLDTNDMSLPQPATLNGNATASNGSNGVNGSNGHNSTNGRAERKSKYLLPTPSDELHDLICVGFGPASLAIAVALHDFLEAGTLTQAPKVLFIEKQERFSWHAGMLLPGAKMQINFIKDMASLRDPRSNFTFLNYLHKNDRLVEFTNMDTFLPARSEYEDYLRWCASYFSDVVRYSNEAVSVQPLAAVDGPVDGFEVVTRSAKTGGETRYCSKRVILAIGGQASIPQCLPAASPKLVHSSEFAHLVPKILNDTSAPYRVAIVGAGQSAAEIFSNIQTLYPNSRTWMVTRQEFLKPSDDSPFVNSVFNPDFVDSLYPRSAKDRRHLIRELKATNYGVVRLNLIEKLYEVMYDQLRELGRDEKQWPHRIMGGRRVVSCEPKGDRLHLRVQRAPPFDDPEEPVLADGIYGEEEEMEADLVIAATGYKRDAHVDMLQSLWKYLPEPQKDATAGASSSTNGQATGSSKPIFDQWEVQPPTTVAKGAATSMSNEDGTTAASARSLAVGRDYKVQFAPGSVAPGSGVWLQGCCEGTHGLSDTLLSILSTRSGDMVNSLFGADQPN